MPVFDASTKIKLAVPDPKTDCKLPSCGGLDYSSITGDSALGGTTGSDCIAVTGDRWQQMDGKLTENYSGDKLINVQGKHTEIVQGNHSLTVTAGNQTIAISSGNVTRTVGQCVSDQVSLNYDIQSGIEFSITTTEADITGSGLVNVMGAMVMINS